MHKFKVIKYRPRSYLVIEPNINLILEVQDILGGMNDFNPSTFSQQPLLPPKQRPNSAQQREKISKGLKPLPRPPSRQTSILRHETSQRISPIPAMNNSSSR